MYIMYVHNVHNDIKYALYILNTYILNFIYL